MRALAPAVAGGEVGKIFTRFREAPTQYSYLGAKPLETMDGDFASVGDLGYIDADGYLFLADQRMDLIITGGANVVPAELEAILTQHPGVRRWPGPARSCADRTGQFGRTACIGGARRASAPAPSELQAATQLRDPRDAAGR
jgi:acyl-CoA synthetase (AMP-forming)/AMP-acid ligase II